MFKVKNGPSTGKTVRSIDIHDGVLFFGRVGSRHSKQRASGLFYKTDGAVIKISDPRICTWQDAARDLIVEDYMPILQVEMEG